MLGSLILGTAESQLTVFSLDVGIHVGLLMLGLVPGWDFPENPNNDDIVTPGKIGFMLNLPIELIAISTMIYGIYIEPLFA